MNLKRLKGLIFAQKRRRRKEMAIPADLTLKNRGKGKELLFRLDRGALAVVGYMSAGESSDSQSSASESSDDSSDSFETSSNSSESSGKDVKPPKAPQRLTYQNKSVHVSVEDLSPRGLYQDESIQTSEVLKLLKEEPEVQSPQPIPSKPAPFPIDNIEPLADITQESDQVPFIPVPIPNYDIDIDLDDPGEWNCRCGKQGPYTVSAFSANAEGEPIQCKTYDGRRGAKLIGCGNWSHKACQVDGIADSKGVRFRCDWCTGNVLPKLKAFASTLSKTAKEKERRSERSKNKARMRLGKPLMERLRAGAGGLAKQGDYWYPIRIIYIDRKGRECRVRWWRGCMFDSAIEPKPAPGSISVVKLDHVVDCLWGDRYRRREIRLGRFVSCDAPEQDEDYILEHFEVVEYQEEIGVALEPAIAVLRHLLDLVVSGTALPVDYPIHHIPAYDWATVQPRGAQMTTVPFPGNLSLIERAQICRFFERHVAGDRAELRGKWTTTVPMAHATTIWLSYQLLRGKKETPEQHLEPENLKKAWEHQRSMTGKQPIRTDVDRECQALLEKRMFEVSNWAGVAGHYQWGLDAGDHQELWNPYEGQEQHNDGSREGTEKELLLGKGYIYLQPPKLSEASH